MVLLRGDRKSVDFVKNSSGMCFVNGGKGADKFTCISGKGYCLDPAEDLECMDGFVVETMSRFEARLCTGEEEYHIPDHSVLSWELVVVPGVEVATAGEDYLFSV